MDNLVGINEMAKILGVPKNWLYQRTRLGKDVVPHVRLGKYLRFKPDEVLAALRQNNGSLRSRG